MTPAGGISRKRTIVFIIALIALVGMGYVYSRFDPVEYGRYFPGCLMKRLTSLSCPSCGNQRALHSLLQGDFHSALHYNLFLPLGLAYVVGMIWGHILAVRRSPWNPVYRFFWGTKGCYTYITAAIIWTVIRNVLNI